jgi:hypothetical protein
VLTAGSELIPERETGESKPPAFTAVISCSGANETGHFSGYRDPMNQPELTCRCVSFGRLHRPVTEKNAQQII